MVWYATIVLSLLHTPEQKAVNMDQRVFDFVHLEDLRMRASCQERMVTYDHAQLSHDGGMVLYTAVRAEPDARKAIRGAGDTDCVIQAQFELNRKFSGLQYAAGPVESNPGLSQPVSQTEHFVVLIAEDNTQVFARGYHGQVQGVPVEAYHEEAFALNFGHMRFGSC